jgi:hypothetical protein
MHRDRDRRRKKPCTIPISTPSNCTNRLGASFGSGTSISVIALETSTIAIATPSTPGMRDNAAKA